MTTLRQALDDAITVRRDARMRMLDKLYILVIGDTTKEAQDLTSLLIKESNIEMQDLLDAGVVIQCMDVDQIVYAADSHIGLDRVHVYTSDVVHSRLDPQQAEAVRRYLYGSLVVASSLLVEAAVPNKSVDMLCNMCHDTMPLTFKSGLW